MPTIYRKYTADHVVELRKFIIYTWPDVEMCDFYICKSKIKEISRMADMRLDALGKKGTKEGMKVGWGFKDLMQLYSFTERAAKRIMTDRPNIKFYRYYLRKVAFSDLSANSGTSPAHSDKNVITKQIYKHSDPKHVVLYKMQDLYGWDNPIIKTSKLGDNEIEELLNV